MIEKREGQAVYPNPWDQDEKTMAAILQVLVSERLAERLKDPNESLTSFVRAFMDFDPTIDLPRPDKQTLLIVGDQQGGLLVGLIPEGVDNTTRFEPHTRIVAKRVTRIEVDQSRHEVRFELTGAAWSIDAERQPLIGNANLTVNKVGQVKLISPNHMMENLRDGVEF